MVEFSLEAKHFASLRAYAHFLQALPPMLDDLNRYSSNWQKQGHQLTLAPDAGRLKARASFSSSFLARYETTVAEAAKACDQGLNHFATFAAECRSLAKTMPDEGRGVRINALDFKRFSLARERPVWFAPKDTRDLVQDLHFRVVRVRYELMGTKGGVNELRVNLQVIVERFLESLTLDACRCHPGYSRLQGWYEGRTVSVGLPLYGLMPAVSAVSAAPGKALAEARLREVSVVRKNADSAINDLGNFLFALRYFLDSAANQLLRLGSNITLLQLLGTLTLVEFKLEQAKVMMQRLRQWPQP